MPPSSETTAQGLAAVLKSARDIMRKDKGLNGDLDRLPMLTWVMFLKFLDDLETQREQEATLAAKKFRPAIDPPYRWRDWAANRQGITGEELVSFLNQDQALRPDGSRGPGLFAYLRGLTSTNGDDRRGVIATVFKGVDNRMRSGYLLRDVINKVAEIHFTSSEELHTLSALYESMLREMRDAAGDSGEFYTPRPVVRFMVEVVDPHLGERVLDPACGTGGFLVEALLHLSKQVKSVADRSLLQEATLSGCEAKSLPYLLAQMNLLLHGLDSPDIDGGNALRYRLSEIGEKDRVDVILTNPPFGGEEEKGTQANFPADRQTAETVLLFLQLIMRRLRRSEGTRPARAAVVVPNTTLFYPGVAARIRRDLLVDFNLWAVVRLPKGVFEPYTDIETNILFFDRSVPATDILFYRLEPPDGRKQYSKTQPLRYDELLEALDILRRRKDSSTAAWTVAKQQIIDDPRASLDLNNPKIVRSTGEDPQTVAQKVSLSTTAVGSMLTEVSRQIAILLPLVSDRTGWKPLHLRSVLTRRKDACEVEDGVKYKRLRIQVKGRGVLLRDEVDGSQIGTKRQFIVQAGQFVLSKIDARNGAFGIVPEECDGAIITGNFWSYDVDERMLDARLLHYLTRSDAFISFCSESSPGSTNRRYLQEELFLEQVVHVPRDPDVQQRLCDVLQSIEGTARAAERDLAALSKRAPVLLQASLHSVFGGAATALDAVELVETTDE